MTDADTTVEPAAEATDPPAETGGQSRGILTASAGIALAAATVAAAWFGYGWARQALFTDVPRAHAREAVLDDARQAAVNLNSVNPADIDGTVRLIESSMSGDLHSHTVANEDRLKQVFRDADTRVEPKVVDAALIELNGERDHAKAILLLQQTQTIKGQQPTRQRVTWELDMVKTGDGWKAEQATALGSPVLLEVPSRQQSPAPAPAAPGPGPAQPSGPTPSQPTKPGS